MIDGLANMVDVGELSSRCVGVLRGESVEHVDEVEKLLAHERSNGTVRSTDLESGLPKSAERPSAEPLLSGKLIAISHVKRAAEAGVTRARLEEMREVIERDVGKFKELLDDSVDAQGHFKKPSGRASSG
jgi:hypothetical protein